MTEITGLANAVSNEFDARIFVYSGIIDNSGFSQLLKNMQPSEVQPHKKNSILILTTHGGSANPAYKIARILQITSEDFILCVPSVCKSAGTLIALGAKRIYMLDVSELGPLDVQLFQRDEIGQRRSGMVIRTALDGLSEECFDFFEKIMLRMKMRSGNTVSLETASRIAASIVSGAMAPVYQQINPEILGNDLRDLNVATAYGERLGGHGGNLKPNAVKHLVSGYPSHDFIIDKAEAEGLFERVDEPPPSLINLIQALGPIVYREHDPHIIKRLDQEPNEGDTDAPQNSKKARSSSVASGRQSARRGSSRRGRTAKGEASQDNGKGESGGK